MLSCSERRVVLTSVRSPTSLRRQTMIVHNRGYLVAAESRETERTSDQARRDRRLRKVAGLRCASRTQHPPTQARQRWCAERARFMAAVPSRRIRRSSIHCSSRRHGMECQEFDDSQSASEWPSRCRPEGRPRMITTAQRMLSANVSDVNLRCSNIVRER